MEYLVTETILRYHKFIVDDDVDMDKVLDPATRAKEDSGYEAICKVLEDCYIDYESQKDYCGSKIDELNVEIL